MTSFSTKFVAFLTLSFLACSVHGLLEDCYKDTCPSLQDTVRTVMREYISTDKRMGASILRLFFHDCFVDGCNAGPLLDEDEVKMSEKTASPNFNSLRGFEVIDEIKTRVEQSCEATVSCADILALAARDGVYLLGGPYWDVPLGRKDTRVVNQALANTTLPGPSSSLSELMGLFFPKGFTIADVVALSGAHTIGRSRCGFVSNRINNDQNIDPAFKSQLQQDCSNSNDVPIDHQSPETFDIKYYVNLVNQQGLFHSDQELYSGDMIDIFRPFTIKKVNEYIDNPKKFYTDFVNAMIKMGNLPSPTQGEIRLNCRNIN